jgi:hypothetical protein
MCMRRMILECQLAYATSCCTCTGNLPRVEGEGAICQSTHNRHIQRQEAHAALAVLDPAVSWDGIANVSQAKRRGGAEVIAAVLQLPTADSMVPSKLER